MLALDTHVLVRFLVEDDEAQTARAARLIDRAIKHQETIFVGDVVLAELAWVLARAYGVPKPELIAIFRKLLAGEQFAFVSLEVLTAAVDAWERGKGNFSDYLVRGQAEAHGCDRVATFDKALLRERGFVGP